MLDPLTIVASGAVTGLVTWGGFAFRARLDRRTKIAEESRADLRAADSALAASILALCDAVADAVDPTCDPRQHLDAFAKAIEGFQAAVMREASRLPETVHETLLVMKGEAVSLIWDLQDQALHDRNVSGRSPFIASQRFVEARERYAQQVRCALRGTDTERAA